MTARFKFQASAFRILLRAFVVDFCFQVSGFIFRYASLPSFPSVTLFPLLHQANEGNEEFCRAPFQVCAFHMHPLSPIVPWALRPWVPGLTYRPRTGMF